MTELVQAARVGAIDAVTLDSPANRNAMSIQLLTELIEAVRASASGDGRGLLLDHTGDVFCSGVDLRERKELGPDDATHSVLLGQLLRCLWTYEKPILCRVGGAVRGGGMGLVACSDIVVAAPEATFAYSEVKVGVAPALVTAVTFPAVSLRPLLPWLLTGDTFDAATAQMLGLVTRVGDSSAALNLDDEIAALLGAGPEAVAVIKRLVRAQQAVDIDAVIAEMTHLSAELFRSSEASEGMAAFAERRRPAWTTAIGPEPD